VGAGIAYRVELTVSVEYGYVLALVCKPVARARRQLVRLDHAHPITLYYIARHFIS
jgi:hypothetical protein